VPKICPSIVRFGSYFQAGDAEVGDFDQPCGQDVDVFGLDVAVDDAFAVGVRQPVQHLCRDAHGFVGGLRALAIHLLAQVVPLQILHHNKVASVLLLGLEDGDDVGVRQRACGARLAQEASDSVLAHGVRRARGHHQLLDGDAAVDARINRLVDHIVAAGDLADNPIVPQYRLQRHSPLL
jgi:hypothetical protein